jgi:hypothetical protein
MALENISRPDYANRLYRPHHPSADHTLRIDPRLCRTFCITGEPEKQEMFFQNEKSVLPGSGILNQKSRFSVDIILRTATLPYAAIFAVSLRPISMNKYRMIDLEDYPRFCLIFFDRFTPVEVSI